MFSVFLHFRNNTGGIRSYDDTQLWGHDEQIFEQKLIEWGVCLNNNKLIILLAKYSSY